MYSWHVNSRRVYGNVVTTIQSPTPPLLGLAEMADIKKELLFIVGDKKTPTDFYIPNTTYFSPDAQENLPYEIVSMLPWNSYTRKMLGYLEAVKSGCNFIRETDDDNFLKPSFFLDFPERIEARCPSNPSLWINPYKYFSDEYIWPRGYPIELIEKDKIDHLSSSSEFSFETVTQIGVIQGLADGAPDVDAIYRLINSNAGTFEFSSGEPLLIPNGVFAPFNSQVTSWSTEILPLMYLPQTCTFRMTDIWRSFIATHLMQLNGYSLIFTGASAFQSRNEHDLMRDFSDEIPGYLGNAAMINVIQSMELLGGVVNLSNDMRKIYSKLVKEGFFLEKELKSLDAWLLDCSGLRENAYAKN
jgi:hypothetical protein